LLARAAERTAEERTPRRKRQVFFFFSLNEGVSDNPGDECGQEAAEEHDEENIPNSVLEVEGTIFCKWRMRLHGGVVICEPYHFYDVFVIPISFIIII
jgi:hypothetical protein